MSLDSVDSDLRTNSSNLKITDFAMKNINAYNHVSRLKCLWQVTSSKHYTAKPLKLFVRIG